MKKIFGLVLFFIFSLIYVAPALAASTASGEDVYVSCHVCGLCPAPFGICIFFYIIAVLVIIIAFVLFRGRSKKCPLCKTKCQRGAQVCAKCGYDFASGLQSTMSIRVADSPELLALHNSNNAKTGEAKDAAVEQTRELTKFDMERSPVSDSAKEFAFEVINASPGAATAQSAPGLVKVEPYKTAPSDTGAIVLETFKKRPARFSPFEEGPRPQAEIKAAVAAPESYQVSADVPLPPVAAAALGSKTCPVCGAEVNPKALFCGKCGLRLPK
jgi:hypothetical protein